ncbi:hypothetical protein ACO9S2_17510 [Nitrospira sp. NS4]|uniref:hypothetical protein n=1 Tax=Nitrospira sp. NS4 TaxID=3414498 RepID=UPI003C2C03AC
MSLLMLSIRHMTKVLMLTLLCAQSTPPAVAFEGDEDFMRRTPVSEDALDRMRGGFQSNPNGPVMSFGIERSVFLNGQLVGSTVLNIPNVIQFAGDPNNSFTLIQTGGGNAVTPGTSSLPPFMTVLQNSLDNQRIQSQTVINATVSALSMARSLALGNALSQATVDTIRH